jgi:hypothetical protein
MVRLEAKRSVEEVQRDIGRIGTGSAAAKSLLQAIGSDIRYFISAVYENT